MGVVGAFVGIAYGVVYGRFVVADAFSQLHPSLVTPWPYLVGLVLLAARAGMVAAVLPARRAARAVPETARRLYALGPCRGYPSPGFGAICQWISDGAMRGVDASVASAHCVTPGQLSRGGLPAWSFGFCVAFFVIAG